MKPLNTSDAMYIFHYLQFSNKHFVLSWIFLDRVLSLYTIAISYYTVVVIQKDADFHVHYYKNGLLSVSLK